MVKDVLAAVGILRSRFDLVACARLVVSLPRRRLPRSKRGR